ncbi:MAG TPA: signal peptidase II, partial [Marinobacter adhaerens]|nr:signal peptidase II [Marinobacter adhaerens]
SFIVLGVAMILVTSFTAEKGAGNNMENRQNG